jgi:hypothetical protein
LTETNAPEVDRRWKSPSLSYKCVDKKCKLWKNYPNIHVSRQNMIPFICFLTKPRKHFCSGWNFDENSKFLWLCELGSDFGLLLRRFPRIFFCSLQFCTLEGSIHLLLSAIGFLMTTNLATEQYGHPYFTAPSVILAQIQCIKIRNQNKKVSKVSTLALDMTIQQNFGPRPPIIPHIWKASEIFL